MYGKEGNKELSVDAIRSSIKKGEIRLDDWCIFNNDWVMLGNLPQFTDLLPAASQNLEALAYFFLRSSVPGPYSFNEVMNLLNLKKISYFDPIYDLREMKWRIISTHDDFKINPPHSIDIDQENKTVINQKKPLNNEFIWQIQKNKQVLGPFRHLEIVKMLQKGVLTSQSLIKKKNVHEWEKIENTSDFSSVQIKKMSQIHDEKVEKSFISRKHDRSTYLSAARVKFDGKAIRGTCSSLSEGGCFIEMSTAEMEVGMEIFIEIMPGAISSTIQTQAQVVSVRDKKPRGIGVKFIELNSNLVEKIQDFVQMFHNKVGG